MSALSFTGKPAWVERRQAANGKYYTFDQFKKLFGDELAPTKWQNAPKQHRPSELAQRRDGAMPLSLDVEADGAQCQGGPLKSPQSLAQPQQKSLQPPTLNQETSAASQGSPGATLSRCIPRLEGLQQFVAQAAAQVPAQAVAGQDPGGLGAIAGPGDAAPQAAAQPAAQPPAAAAAPQVAQPPTPPEPAGERTGQSWTDTVFYQIYLLRKQFALMNAGVKFHRSGTPHGAMVLACTTLYQYLPLLDDDFFEIPKGSRSLKHLLGVPEALFITAEAIPRVTCDKHRAQFRVDFFAYMPSGEVHRYNPGGSSSSPSATHEVIRTDSALFEIDAAKGTGVGHALHCVPPGFASASSRGSDGAEVAALTPAHRKELCDLEYDKKRNSSYNLLQFAVTKAAAMVPYEGEGARRRRKGDINITDGEHFPWWLAIAGSDRWSEIIEEGIFYVAVSIYEDYQPTLRIKNSKGWISVRWTVNGLAIDPVLDVRSEAQCLGAIAGPGQVESTSEGMVVY